MKNIMSVFEKKVSIVVPVYNGEKYVDRCLRGILDQKYKNIECIVVDDGSTDGTGMLCDRYAACDLRIKVVHQENKGLSGARNVGTRYATGDYVVYFDVDDEVTDSLLSENIEIAEQEQADVVMYGFWYYNVETGKKIPNLMQEKFAGEDELFFRNALIPAIRHEVFNAPWNKIYRREFLVENKLCFDENYPIYEDIIFASEMLQYAKKIVINPSMYYIYNVRSSGSLISKYVDKYFESVTRFYQNAMRYCDRYSDNKTQVESFSTLYMKLVTTNLKQISCNGNMSFGAKYLKIKMICASEDVQSALLHANMSRKRKITHFLIRNNMIVLIISMYRVLGGVKKFR